MKPFDTYMAERGRQAELDALRARADGSYERAKAEYEAGGGSYGSLTGDPVTDYMSQILDAINKPLQMQLDADKRAGEFDQNNPFVFDEILAQKSAEERLSPYYEAELRDYVLGANRARGRTVQDEQSFRRELDTTTETVSGRLKQDIDESIRTTSEGYASSGLLNSGARERATGIQDIRGNEDLTSYLRGQGLKKQESLNRQNRTLEDIASDRATYERRSLADKTTALTTDVAQQKKEATARRELERQNYIGYPLGGGTSSVNSLLQYI